jgi:hypothetical protein
LAPLVWCGLDNAPPPNGRTWSIRDVTPMALAHFGV